MICVFTLALSACLTGRPVMPYPERVLVPRPGAQAGLTFEELREANTASPDRDPDGLGVFEAIEPRSVMTLWTGELEAKRQEANRVAYARSEAEQAAALAQAREFHTRHVVFHGRLLAAVPELARAGWYLPEGVYLVDDQGRKFKPELVDEGKLTSERLIYLPPVSAFSSTAEIPRWVTGYPMLVFPGQAITPETRAVTLYFAAAGQRFGFTWIFDPGHDPARRGPGPAARRGLGRLLGGP
jgi:hypothetical protein